MVGLTRAMPVVVHTPWALPSLIPFPASSEGNPDPIEASAVSRRRPRRRSRWRRKTTASCRLCFRRSELMTARSAAIAAALEQEREPEAPADDGNGNRGGSTAANRLQFLCFRNAPSRPPPREAASSAWFVVRLVAKNEGKDRDRERPKPKDRRNQARAGTTGPSRHSSDGGTTLDDDVVFVVTVKNPWQRPTADLPCAQNGSVPSILLIC
jgi:hypothetical protein